MYSTRVVICLCASVLTVSLVGFKLCDQVSVHLHNRFLGFLVFIQNQLGRDWTHYLGGLLHNNSLEGSGEGSRDGGGEKRGKETECSWVPRIWSLTPQTKCE